MLTETKIKNARPGPKTVRLFDAGGLYLEIAPNGGKWWRYKYRYNGKEKRLSLGVYPRVTLKQARLACQDHKRLIDAGIDPSEQRKQDKQAQLDRQTNNFEAIARAWFAERKAGWAPTHADKVIRRLERDVFPILGRRPIAEITGPELDAAIHRIADRGVIETARRALGNIGQIYRYAIRKGLATQDLTKSLWEGMQKKPQANHHAAPTTPDTVATILRMIWDYSGSPIVAAALKLGPLLFVRPGELRTAKWADIDLGAAEWSYTTGKTKTPHIVPLASQAVEILRELRPLTGDSEFVFPAAHSRSRAMSDMAVNAALRRIGVQKSELTGHGWRACARTMLDEQLGFRPDYIEHQLAHAVKDPNGRAYNRTKFLPERRKMMQQWADYLNGLRTDSKITPIRGRAKRSSGDFSGMA